MTKELIEEARQEASIHDKLGDGFSEGSEERAFYYAHRDRYKRLADALDAATGEKADAKIADLVYENVSLKAERDDAVAECRTLRGERNTFEDDLAKEIHRADAAFAVIERIRRAVAGHPKCGRYEEGDAVSCGWKSAYASVVWALDGAPEPEWEYRVEYQVPGGETHVTRPRTTFEDAYGFMLENIHGGTVMRRTKAIPAGPWLPVEGEKP